MYLEESLEDKTVCIFCHSQHFRTYVITSHMAIKPVKKEILHHHVSKTT